MLTSSSPELLSRLREQLAACAYPGYVYGYPHKKAYRDLQTPLSLEEAWHGEDVRHLYCYVHVPFCNQRCSFCNLFTYVPGGESPAPAYLDALGREMAAYARALPGARFARLYVGGGTPTYLSTAELRTLVGHLRDTLGVDPTQAHGCIETSPETLDQGKVEALRELGFQRVSLGVQSLDAEELRQVNRRFDLSLHDKAAKMIGRASFPQFNVDLIYGLPGQTGQSWRSSLQWAIDSPATSLFLYPLYVRPLTGLAVKGRVSLEGATAPTTRQMAALYDFAVERLARAGFRQLTMRQFRRDGERDDDEYRCQRDGMVGLGAGARSYTTRLHYSTPWRMVARNIRGVTDDYVSRMRRGDTKVSYGFALDDDERQRRFVIQSLLYDGLDTNAFRDEFGRDAREAFVYVWEALADEDLIRDAGPRLRLTPRGVRHSDVVGQLFFSPPVSRLVSEYEYDA
jgi:oxygen-independent coproporphyrinogen-3 oxidase